MARTSILVALIVLVLACSSRDTPRSTSSSSSGSGGGSNVDPGPPTTTEGEWVEEVLLGVDVGSQALVVHRWNRSPSVQLFDDSGSADTVLQAAMSDLNAIIAPGDIQMEAATESGDILVHVSDDAGLAAAKAADGVPANFDGSAWALWGQTGALSTVTVLIHQDDVSATRMTEGLARALGVLASSDLFPESLFVTPTTATGIPAVDGALLGWLYTEVSPGFSRIQLRIAFNESWPLPTN
jgi:hypothetical protein